MALLQKWWPVRFLILITIFILRLQFQTKLMTITIEKVLVPAKLMIKIASKVCNTLPTYSSGDHSLITEIILRLLTSASSNLREKKIKTNE